MMIFFINTLNLKSDMHQISPHNIFESQGHENKWNDHQCKKLLIVEQILLVSILGNV